MSQITDDGEKKAVIDVDQEPIQNNRTSSVIDSASEKRSLDPKLNYRGRKTDSLEPSKQKSRKNIKTRALKVSSFLLLLDKSRTDQSPIKPTPEPFATDDDLMIRKLGQIALKSLENGESIKDEIIVHIIIERIRRLPKEKGWIIDGFPLTYNQTKLLEKALSGYDNDKPSPVATKNESVLAPNPRPPPVPPKHVSAIDIILHLNITNETALKRSAGRYCMHRFPLFLPLCCSVSTKKIPTDQLVFVNSRDTIADFVSSAIQASARGLLHRPQS